METSDRNWIHANLSKKMNLLAHLTGKSRSLYWPQTQPDLRFKQSCQGLCSKSLLSACPLLRVPFFPISKEPPPPCKKKSFLHTLGKPVAGNYQLWHPDLATPAENKILCLTIHILVPGRDSNWFCLVKMPHFGLLLPEGWVTMILSLSKTTGNRGQMSQRNERWRETSHMSTTQTGGREGRIAFRRQRTHVPVLFYQLGDFGHATSSFWATVPQV